MVVRLTPLRDDIERAYKVAGNRTVSVLVPHPNARPGASPRVLLVAGAGKVFGLSYLGVLGLA